MRFSIFSDLHHYPGVFMGGTYEDLDFIRERAKKAGANFIIHAGDFCHGAAEVPEYVKYYNDFDIPTYHCLGNHDTDHTSYEETLKYYQMEDGHYYFDNDGYRFIILDPNYYLLDNGEYVHYDMGNYYKQAGRRNYIPPEQVVWLEQLIATAPHPCVLISHESLERDPDGVRNRKEVQKIINDANKRKPHSVILCINGHYHRDFIRIMDNVCYFDLNSTSFDWFEKRHNFFPEELCKQYKDLTHTVVYNDPVHAIITLEGTTITIEGMESDMFMGVEREHTDNVLYDLVGRPTTAKVQSAKIVIG